MKLLLTFILLTLSLFANANLYMFVFKEGKSLQNVEVQAGDAKAITNEYGYAKFNLKSDSYEISYTKDGKLFALEDVKVVDNVDSQLFLNLTNSSATLDLDLPLESYEQDFKKIDITKLKGQTGKLKLSIVDSKTKQPVEKAKLFFKGYVYDGMSDKTGVVHLDIVKGTYDISIIHPNYVMKILKDVKVKKDAVTHQVIEIVKSDIALDEYVVLAPAVEGSLASTFSAMRESDKIGDIVGSEQFSKLGDSSASGALKRVSGITVVGGKYVYIRGLGERYSTVLLNGLNVPSPNPLKRVVPLDLFPTSIIQNMSIQKTYSPDLPGNFGGGAVDIETKGIPKEDNYIQASIGLSHNSATGSSGVYNSSNDVSIPSNILSATDNFQSFGDSTVFTEEDKIEYAKELSRYRTLDLSKKSIEPGKSASISVGQSFKTSGGLKYGFAGNIYYKTDGDIKEFLRREYSTSPDGTLTSLGNTGDYQNTKLSEKKGGLVSLEVDNEDGQSAKFTSMLLNQNSDSTTYGYVLETGSNNRVVKRNILRYTEEEMNLNQLTGTNTIFLSDTTEKLFDDIVINWGLETGTAKNKQPGTVDYEYHYYGDLEEFPYDETLFKLYTDKPINYTYSDLEDNLDDKKISLTLPFELNDQKNFIEFGISEMNKDRILDTKRYAIQYEQSNSDECKKKNISQFLGGFEIKEGCYYDRNETLDSFFNEYAENGYFTTLTPYKPSDYYEAKQDIKASYFRTKVSPIEELDVIFGIRYEKSIQKMKTISLDSGEKIVKEYELETDDELPEVSSIFRLNDEMQIKANYSKSISRPDFREFVNNTYTDPITAASTVGYSGLTYTTIDNFDIGFEHYFNYDEMYSISLFQKNFDKPIETVVNEVGDRIGYTLRNADKAVSTGVEIGFRKKFDFIHKDLTNYFISGNYSVIDSKITLAKNSGDQVIDSLRTKERPMQGQSPYVVNLNLGFDNLNTGRSAVFSYNEFGERIIALGTLDAGTVDLYEQPFKKLDFTLKWRINDTYDINEKKIGYAVSFKAKNLLDSESIVKHENKTVEKYKPGQSYNFNFSMKY